MKGSPVFTINQDFIDKVFDKYERAYPAMGEESTEPDSRFGELRLAMLKFLSSDAHGLHQVSDIIHTAFWASLARVESRHHGFELEYCDHDLAGGPFVLSESIECDPDGLAKLAVGVPTDATIGIWPEANGELKIWGFERWASEANAPCLRVGVVQPGCIVVGCGGPRYFKAVLTATKCGMVNRGLFERVRRRLQSLDGEAYDWFGENRARYYRLKPVLRYMVSHGHGGTLLIIPAASEGGVEGIEFVYKSPSVVTSKPAIRGRVKTGHMSRPGLNVFYAASPVLSIRI